VIDELCEDREVLFGGWQVSTVQYMGPEQVAELRGVQVGGYNLSAAQPGAREASVSSEKAAPAELTKVAVVVSSAGAATEPAKDEDVATVVVAATPEATADVAASSGEASAAAEVSMEVSNSMGSASISSTNQN